MTNASNVGVTPPEVPAEIAVSHPDEPFVPVLRDLAG
jgi:hypothetical protein